MDHECTHWTRHPSRLNRDLGRKQWGDAGYAMEELVAEIGSAFLCAELDLTPEIREDHAAYIENWLKVLKSDKHAIFTAARYAQKAADFLRAALETDSAHEEPERQARRDEFMDSRSSRALRGLTAQRLGKVSPKPPRARGRS